MITPSKDSGCIAHRSSWLGSRLDRVFWKAFEGTKLSKNATGTKGQPLSRLLCTWSQGQTMGLYLFLFVIFYCNFQRTISRYIAKFGHSDFGFIPTTYILPRDRRLLRENWKHNETYIMKPAASARGIGIKLVNKLDQGKVFEIFIMC